MAIRRHVSVKGRVQEPLFSREAARIAAAIKVNGWVRACGDGSVEACFEGQRRDVEAMVSWCFVGPKRTKVEEVIVRREHYRGVCRSFRIIDDTFADCQDACRRVRNRQKNAAARQIAS